MLNAQEGLGPGDRFIARLLKDAPVPVVIAVNKVDRANRAALATTLQAAAELDLADEIYPVSARRGSGMPALVEHLVTLLPEGPFYFQPDQRSDQPESVAPGRARARAGAPAHPRGGPARRRG